MLLQLNHRSRQWAGGVLALGLADAAPTSGASCNLGSPFLVTIAGGVVSQEILANATAGTYTVMASANGAANGVVFHLMDFCRRCICR